MKAYCKGWVIQIRSKLLLWQKERDPRFDISSSLPRAQPSSAALNLPNPAAVLQKISVLLVDYLN